MEGKKQKHKRFFRWICHTDKNMRQEIPIIDRISGEKLVEKIPCHSSLEFLYSKGLLSKFSRSALCKTPLFSALFGALQKTSLSKKKIIHFIEKYEIDTSEFADPVESFRCFNDFFTRKLKVSSRPINPEEKVAICPADGRYFAFQNLGEADGIFVKGQKFLLSKLLQSDALAQEYGDASLVMVRLAPVDYHRFHFPCACIPEKARLINGPLYSVNPIALRQSISILHENKRYITPLSSEQFGTVICIEVGATNVGTVIQTFNPGKEYVKGEEKGYFSFGGSCILLLFSKGSLKVDQDLIDNTQDSIETICQMGQSIGKNW